MRNLAAFMILAVFVGCDSDKYGVYQMDIDGPVMVPAVSLPMDTSRTARVSVWGGIPSVTKREGVYLYSRNIGPWLHDSVMNTDGSWSPVLLTDPNTSLGSTTVEPNLRWNLPRFQGGLYGELSFASEAAFGVGLQVSTGSARTHWMVEGRYVFNFPADRPVVRTSIGGFVGSQWTRATYYRQFNEEPAYLFETTDYTRSDGYFCEVFLSDPAPKEGGSIFLGILFSYQNLYSFRIPPTAQPQEAVRVDEIMRLWAFSAGATYPLSERTSILLGFRVIWEPTIDESHPGAYVMPLVQFDWRL